MPSMLDELNELSHAVIGAAIEAHKHLGPGLHESIYEQALVIELGLRNITFVQQHPIRLRYKGHDLGEGRLDLLVGNGLVVELKAVEALNDAHAGQMLGYLKAGGFQLGLLINFNVPRLRDGTRRYINTKQP